MANPTNVIADAFEKLKRSISEEDANNFACTDLQDVWKAVREIENTQRKRQSAQNMRRIEPLLRGIEKYSKVIEVLCNGTPYLAFIWAPIKLMLQLASGHRDIFDALLSAYADIGAALPRFDRYEKAFGENCEFRNVLALVYREILDFHQRAYKFFRRRAWSVLFLSLWKDFNSRFSNIIDSLKKQRDFVDTEAASLDIVEAKDSRAKLQHDNERRQKEFINGLERNERNERIARLQHSIEWLSVDDTLQEAEYERISDRQHNGTCEWITRLPDFENWLKDDTKHPLLWLSGKPGAGKSVMCSYIIKVLEQTPGLTICYYFCNSLNAGTASSDILRTISLQLLRSYVDLASLIAHEYVYRGFKCGITQLRVLIQQLLEVVPYTRIIIDGLDECSKEDQKAVLKELQPLCLGSKTHCKVLISSRREVYLREKLSGHQYISLEETEEVESDIRLYVKYKIRKLRTSDQNLLKKIESQLVEKADGMFLWVRLMVDELRQCYSDADLEERATSLPKGLEKAYGRILDRILDEKNSPSVISIAIRILEWMSCSYRLLKFYEILDGISFRAAESSNNNTDHSSCTVLDNSTKFQKEVLDLCKPLVEDGPANTLDFVHFSAKE